MRIDDQSMRGWAKPIIVSAATVAVLEAANLLRAGFGLVVGVVIAVFGVAALLIINRRKR